MWRDAKVDPVGDEAWHVIHGGYTETLLVRSGSTLLRISFLLNDEMIPEEEKDLDTLRSRSLEEQRAVQFELGAPVRRLAERVAVHLVDNR